MESSNPGSGSLLLEDLPLTQQQKAAVKADFGPTLVIAGAGTGKTMVLAKRFDYLINVKEIDPKKVLMVTFSRKASNHMKNRIIRYIPYSYYDDNKKFSDELSISTLHSFARKLLLEEDGSAKVVYDEKARHMIVDAINRCNLKITAKSLAWELITNLRWICKKRDEDSGFTEQDVYEAAAGDSDLSPDTVFNKFSIEDLRILYDEYDKDLKRRNAFTFDDLLLYANIRLRDASMRSKWSAKYDAILIDEFQDIDDVQFEILKNLSASHKNIFAVGDPDQAIYGFRGAMSGIFSEFKKHFGDQTQIFKLEENFRSTPEILKVANTLINSENQDNPFRKELVTQRPSGPGVVFFKTDEPSKEDEWVVEQIKKLHEAGVFYKDIAILTRNHKHNETVRFQLMKEKITYFYERERKSWLSKSHVREALAWFVISSGDPSHSQFKDAISAVIKKSAKGIGTDSVFEILASRDSLTGHSFEQALLNSTKPQVQRFNSLRRELVKIAHDDNLSLQERFREIITLSNMLNFYNYSKDPTKIEEVFHRCDQIIEENETESWDAFVDYFSQGMDLKFTQNDVFVSTIHGAKGLEFKYVFLLKFDEGCLPSELGMKRAQALGEEKVKEDIAEERRLTYVAFTRAQDKLHISSSKNPSRFAEDIKELLEPAT